MTETLTITRPGVAAGWHFTSAPMLDPEPLLVGRRVDDALELLPRLFNLCAAAHRAAASHALGMSDAGNASAMQAETVRDHGVALFHLWPSVLGAATDRDGLALLGHGAPNEIVRHVCGGDNLPEFSSAHLASWLARGATPAACLLRDLRERLDPAWGRVALRDLETEALDTDLLEQAPSPRWEATALGRVRAAPVIRALLREEGASLFVRLLARIVDLSWMAMGGGTAQLHGKAGAGIGYAQASRGILVHQAKVKDGRVLAYRVRTPSAWNLAPGGLFAQMLAALPARREAQMLARIAECAVNPCVPLALHFAPEA
ncbi:nickel-dependent hydrogenase large subunit [Roseixanthobacter glucoisosaccharinicivorans]|uniref:nickel-dependent hydrogenase large subunit n=1 Tax=Roseixanthobacter glucoisosaccharinicivorans TaxID=3119923 RepID=UPI0037279CF2